MMEADESSRMERIDDNTWIWWSFAGSVDVVPDGQRNYLSCGREVSSTV